MKRVSGMIATVALSALIAASSVARAQDAPDPNLGPLVDIYTDADAQAVLNARLVALKTVLELTADQEKLWPPVEAAIRTIAKDAAARGKQRETADPPMDFLDVMDRIADSEIVRAQALKTFVTATRPLVASLTEEQKRRVPAFLGMTDNPDAPQPSGEFWFFEDEQG